MMFAGLRDAIDDSDPCSVNPQDPVCVAIYGSPDAATKAAIHSTADDPTPGEITFDVDPSDCRFGTSWDASKQQCVSWFQPITNVWDEITAAGPQLKTAGIDTSSSAAAALPSVGWKVLLGMGLLTAVGFGGYYAYKKHKRK